MEMRRKRAVAAEIPLFRACACCCWAVTSFAHPPRKQRPERATQRSSNPQRPVDCSSKSDDRIPPHAQDPVQPRPDSFPACAGPPSVVIALLRLFKFHQEPSHRPFLEGTLKTLHQPKFTPAGVKCELGPRQTPGHSHWATDSPRPRAPSSPAPSISHRRPPCPHLALRSVLPSTHICPSALQPHRRTSK